MSASGLEGLGEENEPIGPLSSGNGEGFLHDDPDSVEDVLHNYGMDDDILEESALEIPVLIDMVTDKVKDSLGDFTWTGSDRLDTENLLEICERLVIEIQSEDGRFMGHEVLAAFEDLGFELEHRNYKARALERVPSLDDIEELAIKIEGIKKLQQDMTHAAYIRLGRYIKDPILALPDLIAQKARIYAEQQEIGKRTVSSMNEYDEREMQRRKLDKEYQETEKAAEELTFIDEIRFRRERAFRRVHWLTKQDFMHEEVNSFLFEAQSKKIAVDFDTFAGFLAGRFVPDQVVFKNGIIVKNGDKGVMTAEPTSEVETVDRYIKGLVEKKLEAHLIKMTDQTNKTANDRLNDALMLRRLIQAKAICVSLQKDISDGIYTEVPVSQGQQDLIELIRRKVYIEGDPTVLDDFISYLPGSNLRDAVTEELNAPLQEKFSGRSVKDVFSEIDKIIEQDSNLDIEIITSMVTTWEDETMSYEQRVDMAISALTILEKLAYKEKHSVRNLLLDE